MSFSEFIKAIEREDIDEVETLFRQEFINKKMKGCTPLHYACMYNNESKVVHYLIQNKCNIEERSVHGLRCIHLSVMRGNVEILRTLIKAGCSLDSPNKKGKRALELAIELKNQECEKILREAKLDKPIKNELNQLKRYSLSKMIDMQAGKTLLDKLVSSEDPRIINAIREKPVNDEEIQKLRNLKSERVNPESLKLLQECMLARCILNKYYDGVYDLCTAELVNKESLFKGSTALETAAESELSVFAFGHILRKLVKEDESWEIAENIAKRKNQERIVSLIEDRRNYLKSQENNYLRVATIENETDTIRFILKNVLDNSEKRLQMIEASLELSYNIGHSKCTEILNGGNVDGDILEQIPGSNVHIEEDESHSPINSDSD